VGDGPLAQQTIYIRDPVLGDGIGFTWSPAAPRPGQEVTFTAACMTCVFFDPDAYVWKFPGGARKTGSIATFTFPVAGSFEVVLDLATLHTFETVTTGSE
jgi:PKD domain